MYNARASSDDVVTGTFSAAIAASADAASVVACSCCPQAANIRATTHKANGRSILKFMIFIESLLVILWCMILV